MSKMHGMIKKIAVLAIALTGLICVACNVEPEVEYRVDLALADSLSKDKGKYDSLIISFVHANGDTLQPLAFSGPFMSGSSGGVIRDLLIGNEVPTEYFVVIKAFQGNQSAIYSVRIKDKSPDSLVVVVAIQKSPNPDPKPNDTIPVVIKPTAPKALILSDSVLTLGVSSNPRQVFAALQPTGVSGLVQFVSTHPASATVDESGFITPVAVGESQIIASVIGQESIADTLLVKVIVPPAISAVTFARPAPLLYTGAPGIKLTVTHQPANLPGAFEFKSSDHGIVTISSDGTVAAKTEGSAIITVTALGSTSVTDTLTIRAVRDAPFIDAGTTQSVPVGQPVTIKVKVTQAFGTLNLSWDFNADGQPEGQTTQDTTTATHTYATQGDYSAVFTAKDGEGNTTTQSIRVRVGKAGPLVIITSPKQDTLVNSPNFTVSYTSDGIPKTQAFTLLEGITTLTVKDSNATGIDSASVKATLDTKAPVVKITAPANGLVTNLPEIDVAWTVDSIAQNTGRKENLLGKQGAVAIIREFTDAAGNRGRDSISITRDTVPPLTPVFAGGDTSTNVKRPTWTWTSGGGGNGTFTVQLGTTAAEEVTTARYQPLADLKDSTYTLRVRERDAAGNWSTWASKTIAVKTSSPGAPRINYTLTTASLTNNKRPTWAWLTSGLNGASGFFRWSVTTPTPVTDSGTATSYTPAVDLPDGTYTLNLQERDGLGNWSNSVTWEIRISTQGALVKITAPARGSYTNVKGGVITVAWEINGALQNTQGTDTLKTEGGWNRIRREYRDAANNLSFDTLSVFWDTTAPRVAISNPANGAYVNQLIVPVIWTVDLVQQNTRAADTLSGTDGPKTIIRSFTDAAGNPGSASITVNLDRAAPAAPVVSAVPTSPTTDQTPTWTWTGTGPFEYHLTNSATAPTGAGTAIAVSPFTPGTDLAEGTWRFYVRERDMAMNWSAWSSVNTVQIDITLPNAPTLSRGASPTSGDATWTWTANGDNTGGSGLGTTPLFRYSLNTGTTWTETSATAHTITTAGTHTLIVQVRDLAGRWSASSTAQTVVVDRSTPAEPTFTATPTSPQRTTTASSHTWTWGAAGTYQWILNQTSTSPSPTTTGTANSTGTYTRTGTLAEGNWYFHVRASNAAGTWSPWATSPSLVVDNTAPIVRITHPSADGFITNTSTYAIRYQIDNGPEQTTNCALGVDGGNNNCAISATDPAGNSGSATRVIIRRSNVVFVTPSGNGDFSGSDWINTMSNSNFESYVNSNNVAGKEFWLGSGTYNRFPSPGSDLTVLGGFNAANRPNSKAGRNRNATIFATGISIAGGNILLDGMIFNNGLLFDQSTVDLIDITIAPESELVNALDLRGSANLTNLIISNATFTDAAVLINGTARFIGGQIISNSTGTGGIFGDGASIFLDGAINISSNTNMNYGTQITLGSESQVVISSGVNFSCEDVSLLSRTSTCR